MWYGSNFYSNLTYKKNHIKAEFLRGKIDGDVSKSFCYSIFTATRKSPLSFTVSWEKKLRPISFFIITHDKIENTGVKFIPRESKFHMIHTLTKQSMDLEIDEKEER